MDYSLMLLGQLSSHLEKQKQKISWTYISTIHQEKWVKTLSIKPWLSCLDHHPMHQKAAGSIAGRGT